MRLRAAAAVVAFSFALVLALLAAATSEADSSAAISSVNWAQTGTTTLSERQHASVAYNPDTSQLVLFGGDNTVNVVDDTWVFDGTRWNRLQPPGSPTPRTSAAMAYFPVTKSVILFGGDTHTVPNGLRNGTWSFDGSAWSLLNPANRPEPRYGATLAYDPTHHELVLFGGEGENGLLGDTWTFDGNDWTQVAGTAAPSLRYGAVMGYDSVSGGLILFGGIGFNAAGAITYLGDTWLWKDHQWTQLSPSASPSSRWGAAMAEGAPGGLTLFGGYSDTSVPSVPFVPRRMPSISSVYNDTWIWNGSNWTQSKATGPAARYASAIVRKLDPGQYTAILRGKNATTGIGLVEVYDLDGTAPPELANISTRGFVETGDNVMIGGFIAGPKDRSGPAVVVRALGPSLAAAHVPQTIDDPTLELRDQNGALIAANDDWATDGEAAKVTAAGLAPTDPRESAFYREVPVAAFTAIVRGKGASTGNALLEVYKLH